MNDCVDRTDSIRVEELMDRGRLGRLFSQAQDNVDLRQIILFGSLPPEENKQG